MTKQTSLRDRALAFHALHVPGRPLVLPNAWDTASALIVAHAGAAAVATTSAGLAWGLGAADGDQVDRDRALGVAVDIAEQAERIAVARAAADTADVPLFVNARIDTFLRGAGVGAPPTPFGQWGRTSPWSGPPPSGPRAPTGSSSPGPSNRGS